jgi:hypothetical protein
MLKLHGLVQPHQCPFLFVSCKTLSISECMSLKSSITSDESEENGRELQWLIYVLCLQMYEGAEENNKGPQDSKPPCQHKIQHYLNTSYHPWH